MFGGEINYSNLWLYLQQLLQGETITVDEPNPIHWCGIYHPRAKKVYTDLAEYQRDFASAAVRQPVFFFIATNGCGAI